jgi:hypothetical protein
MNLCVCSFHPLLTPSGCAGSARLLSDPPLSPRHAADIYAGKLERVAFDTLHDAQRISRFAVAAYGLQSVIWAKGQRPAMCLANANRLVKCLKKPFGLESKFRKRNFDAIIEMTGVAPSDLLYVSYANVAGGVLPYLIMLHRPSKSVVLSVRGTGACRMDNRQTTVPSPAPADCCTGAVQRRQWARGCGSRWRCSGPTLRLPALALDVPAGKRAACVFMRKFISFMPS